MPSEESDCEFETILNSEDTNGLNENSTPDSTSVNVNSDNGNNVITATNSAKQTDLIVSSTNAYIDKLKVSNFPNMRYSRKNRIAYTDTTEMKKFLALCIL